MTRPSPALNDADAIPAATLVVMRDRSPGPPDLLFVERATAMAFAAGATVFPGGRVDAQDRLLAEALGGSDIEDTAARIAAIRETIEETGLAIGLTPGTDADTVRRIRAALAGGLTLAAILAEEGLGIDPDVLVPFARWRPPHGLVRRFDTRFFLVRWPIDSPAPEVDGTENTRLFWGGAQSVLEAADAGRVSIIFPTRRNLERLARFASYDAAAAHARATPQRLVEPWSEWRDGEEYLCIPDDLGYPVTAERRADARRG
ncbi:NUDIX domain-containing protein [Sphingomonas endophytica]|uniref:NUDIX hydrolase n=1 Tax=Sphingomonas endophytica TaxID=869719 RepID=A0A147I6K8_9SPHN|nr:NUDIX domain-containing protein [Sphingomonas endophytica]KTT74598.1 NUDIX hydrolase [Sphingomonas endophytica]